MLKVCSLGSGSKGNCVYIESEKVRLLIDAGLSFPDIERRLRDIGVSIEAVSGIILTHEHSDHICGLAGFCSPELTVYAESRVAGFLKNRVRGPRLQAIDCQAFEISGLVIRPFGVMHDALRPLGYRIENGAFSIGFATDLGIVTERVADGLRGCDCLIVEANHDREMLIKGPYPSRLKTRIYGPRGHLSNAAAAELIAVSLGPNTRQVFLAHLSEENNLPELAFDTVAGYLSGRGINESKSFKIEVLKQYSPSAVLEF